MSRTKLRNLIFKEHVTNPWGCLAVNFINAKCQHFKLWILAFKRQTPTFSISNLINLLLAFKHLKVLSILCQNLHFKCQKSGMKMPKLPFSLLWKCTPGVVIMNQWSLILTQSDSIQGSLLVVVVNALDHMFTFALTHQNSQESCVSGRCLFHCSCLILFCGLYIKALQLRVWLYI